jgi:NAD(P)-dependent dehydrogenase (short-subunit alcohol dehydrogenase family)
MATNEFGRSHEPRVALVSGCSSGIGRLTARRLARAGWVVYTGLRRPNDPSESADPHPPGLRPLPLDVTNPAQLRSAIDQVSSQSGRLDALVNNAGVDSLGALEDQPEEALRSVMEVNFFGAMALTRLALPLMRRGRRGIVVMVSSLSGLIGLPGSSAYCASKFALEGATEALRNEVGRFGIGVALIEPGAFATAMSAKRRLPPHYPPSSPYWPMLEHLARAASPEADASPVAELILEVIESGAPQLRYPAGAQARAVVAHMGSLDDSARERYARGVADLDWWHHGGPGPVT